MHLPSLRRYNLFIENFVNSDGVRLWTVQTGQGSPVMMCNGGPGCCDYLQPVAEMLDDMAQVIRFEERGCGRSESGKTEEGERLPEFIYPPNREVNEQLNRAWKTYIQNPDLLLTLSKLQVPALFVYGERDIRPSWPIKQVAQLMSKARFELIVGAEHVIWLSHADELRVLLREFIDQVV